MAIQLNEDYENLSTEVYTRYVFILFVNSSRDVNVFVIVINRNPSLKSDMTNCCKSYVKRRNDSSRGCNQNCARACRDRGRFLSCSKFACATKMRMPFFQFGRPARRLSTRSKKARVSRSATSWLPERGSVLIKRSNCIAVQM